MPEDDPPDLSPRPKETLLEVGVLILPILIEPLGV